MKKLICSIAITLACSSFSLTDSKVFVCDSSTSVAYHDSKECRGLSKCTHNIIEVTKKVAIENYNKRACKICY